MPCLRSKLFVASFTPRTGIEDGLCSKALAKYGGYNSGTGQMVPESQGLLSSGGVDKKETNKLCEERNKQRRIVRGLFEEVTLKLNEEEN